MADRMVQLAEDWRPDLVVHTPNGVAGQLVAARTGAPSVLHAVGFGHTSAHVRMMNNALAPAYERHGLDGPATVSAWLDVAPPSMSTTDEPRRWSMRYVPYNGGGRLPDWLSGARSGPGHGHPRHRASRRRRGVTGEVGGGRREGDGRGVRARPRRRGPQRPGHPARQRDARGLDPAGVLLAHSDAVVHHGGSGTTLTALDSGLPQIVLGEGADRPANAAAVRARGCGLVPDGPDDLTPRWSSGC
ncbi:nucleotide disphospho-sugar-binding domain-containing protein [Streptomyces sp. M19]